MFISHQHLHPSFLQHGSLHFSFPYSLVANKNDRESCLQTIAQSPMVSKYPSNLSEPSAHSFCLATRVHSTKSMNKYKTDMISIKE